MQEQPIHWRSDALTRIPYSLYRDPQLPEQEQEKIFRGNTWNFLCLDAELGEVLAGTRPGRTSPPFPGHEMQDGQILREDWFPVLRG